MTEKQDFDLSHLYRPSTSDPKPADPTGLIKNLSKGIAGKVAITILVSTIGGFITHSATFFKFVTSACAVVGTLGGEDAEKVKKKAESLLRDSASPPGPAEGSHKPTMRERIQEKVGEPAKKLVHQAGEKIDDAKEEGKQKVDEVKDKVKEGTDTAKEISANLKNIAVPPEDRQASVVQPEVPDRMPPGGENVASHAAYPIRGGMVSPGNTAPQPPELPTTGGRDGRLSRAPTFQEAVAEARRKAAQKKAMEGVGDKQLPENPPEAGGRERAMPFPTPPQPILSGPLSKYNAACPRCGQLMNLPDSARKSRSCTGCGTSFMPSAAHAAFFKLQGKRY